MLVEIPTQVVVNVVIVCITEHFV